MTFEEAYQFGTRTLQEAGVSDGPTDAWLLLESVTNVSRMQYYLEPKKRLTEEEEVTYLEQIERRKSRVPLQHITGVQEFMGHPFHVNEHVLIPRQDTEVLVETVLDYLQEGMRVLDLCTGSGCILISLAKWMRGKIEGVGVDISEEALRVAKDNAKRLEADVSFIQSDLFTNVEGTFDVIVSNPPYIRTAVIEELEEEVKLHDPFLALDGKEDGLYFYRAIIAQSRSYLRKGGALFFEIGYDQGADVKQLLEAEGFDKVIVKKDLAGLDRVVIAV